MYVQVTETMFLEAFKQAGRADNFSYDGLRALYDFFEDMGSEGDGVELDVIAICCDYSEQPLQDVLDNYGLESLEELQEETLVVAQLENGHVVYQVF